MSNLPWQPAEERIKGLKEADLLEKIHYVSLSSSSADSVLGKVQRVYPTYKINKEYAGKSGTSHAEMHTRGKVVNEVLSQVPFAVGPLGP